MIEYRKAAVSDAEELARVRTDFLSVAQDQGFGSAEEREMLYRKILAFFTESLSNGSFTAWVAADGGKIIATGGVNVYRLPPNKGNPSGKTACISNMFTYPEYRNRGIATKLFDLVVEEAKNSGCGRLRLNATDMGRPIYEKYGFTDASGEMVFSV